MKSLGFICGILIAVQYLASGADDDNDDEPLTCYECSYVCEDELDEEDCSDLGETYTKCYTYNYYISNREFRDFRGCFDTSPNSTFQLLCHNNSVTKYKQACQVCSTSYCNSKPLFDNKTVLEDDESNTAVGTSEPLTLFVPVLIFAIQTIQHIVI